MFNVLYCIVVTIRPVYRKFVLPSRKSLEIIINKNKNKNKNEQITSVGPDSVNELPLYPHSIDTA